MRMRDIAMSRIRYGCWRIYIPLRREGWVVNHKKAHRLYCQEGLNLRAKKHTFGNTTVVAHGNKRY